MMITIGVVFIPYFETLLIFLFRGRFFRYHVIFHSLILWGFWSVIGAWLIDYGFITISFTQALRAIWIGVAVHCLTLLIRSRSVQLFFPLWKKPVTLALMTHFDPFMIFTLSFFFLFVSITGVGDKRFFWLTSVVMLFYLLVRGWIKIILLRRFRPNEQLAKTVLVLPTFQIYRWRVIMVKEQNHLCYDINFFKWQDQRVRLLENSFALGDRYLLEKIPEYRQFIEIFPYLYFQKQGGERGTIYTVFDLFNFFSFFRREQRFFSITVRDGKVIKQRLVL